MKKIYFLFLCISINSFSQIKFDKGYFIDNSNKKIECFIRNIDWLNNPTKFEYKISENSEQKTNTITDVKEFGIYNSSKYIRALVDMDLSNNELYKLSESEELKYEEKQAFFKVLIEGNATLFEYVDGNLVKFLYKKNDSEIEQLILKKYKNSDNNIVSNEEYKKQLWLHLKCNNITFKSFKYLEYKKRNLVDFFLKYNKCKNEDYINYEKNKKQDLFNLNVRIGLNNSSLSTNNTTVSSSTRYPDFESKIGLRAGLELEYIFPFNNNKWAFIVEPTYQSYKVENEGSVRNSVDYSSLELPFGIRHYMFINKNSKLFLNGSYIIDFSSGKALNLEIESSGNLGFGLGYKRNDKLSLEFRYHTSRDLFYNYRTTFSNYNTVSLIFGYTIF